MNCKTVIYLPFLYTIFNKFGCVESKNELLRHIWGYYIWATLIHEFGGPSLLLVIRMLLLLEDPPIVRLLAYGVWLIALLIVYEIGYIINDLFAYFEPINIRNPRLSKLFPFYDFSKIKGMVLQAIFLRAALITSIISYIIIYSLELAYIFTITALFIVFFFLLHSLTHSLLIRGLITEFSLRALRILSVVGFYSCSLARLALLLYSIAKGIVASHGYFSSKKLAKVNLTRPIELLFNLLIMMLGFTLITYREYLCYFLTYLVLLLPSSMAVIIRKVVRSAKGDGLR